MPITKQEIAEYITDLYFDLKWAEKQQREAPAPTFALYCEIDRIKTLIVELEKEL